MITQEDLRERRERVFLVLAGFFICAMTLLNVMGLTRFIQLGPMALAVGVLPYPLTFLCTDLISELYGRSRANFVVSLGLVLNVFIIGILYLGAAIPSVGPEVMPPWQLLQLEQAVAMPNGATLEGTVELYSILLACTSGAVVASMLAYVTAQYCDVQLFHFFKRLTKGRHLWLRNNFSTLCSQGVDSVVVISVTFGAVWLSGNMAFLTLLTLMASNYIFKMLVALADTLPFYVLTSRLKRYLQLS